MNQVVGEKNFLDKSGGGGKRPVRPFTRNKFWKCIGYILLEVTYGNKGHMIWGKPEASIRKKGRTPLRNLLHRDVFGETDLLKVRCYIYHTNYFYDCHWNILSNTNSFIYWILL